MDTSREAIVTWCQEYLGQLLEVPAAAIDPLADFDRLGVDSALAVALLIEVEERFGVDLSPDDLYENPTLDAVAGHLHEQLTAPATHS
ncbi:acyl carrier protein [Nocardia rhizosphaerihabitans]|uniref:Phosphopantetheine-binding protein n=1 Tax=Nocardia rhizosphaerihabitans TaxID=1691570 RepID=A0ABQ2K5C6_9NOCA|nr:acyl carrier protein [Nocardia rhizosphaerihabitans]GGN67769.1 phosphopantetheine-binding protein [Nocardia rhizosphaerihabitans]